MTEVYRYELKDGGGPFLTLSGHIRTRNDTIYDCDDGWISCCPTIESLKKWFKERNIDTSTFVLMKYTVPTKSIKKTCTHLVFPKKIFNRWKCNQ